MVPVIHPNGLGYSGSRGLLRFYTRGIMFSLRLKIGRWDSLSAGWRDYLPTMTTGWSAVEEPPSTTNPTPRPSYYELRNIWI